MTQEQKLAAIREKVIEANPEIGKLGEGCMVLVGDRKLSHTIYGKEEGFYLAYLNRPFPREMRYNDFYDCKFQEGAEGVEILGRRIGIADVLLACAKFAPRWEINVAGKDGKILSGGMAADMKNFSCWNLRQDDLSKNPQTWDLLYELFFPKAETQSSKEAS